MVGVFERRERLSRKNRLIYLQRVRFDEPDIGRDKVPFVKEENISRDDLIGGDQGFQPHTDYTDMAFSQLFQSPYGGLGPVFLKKTEKTVDDKDSDDEKAVGALSQCKRQHNCGNQYSDNRAFELAEKNGGDRTLLVFECIVSVYVQTPNRFFGIDTRRGTFKSIVKLFRRL